MFIGLLVGIFIGLVNGMFIGLVIGMFIGLINGLVIEPPSFPELLAAVAARHCVGVAAVRRQAARPRPFESLMGIIPGDAEGKGKVLSAIAVPVKNRGCLSRRAIVRAISRAAPTGGTVLKTLARVSAGPRAIHSAQEARAGDARQPAAANRPRRPTNLIADGTTLCARHGTLRQRLTKSCAATMRIAATSLPGRHGNAPAETHACDAASRITAPFTLARSTSTVCPEHEPVGLYLEPSPQTRPRGIAEWLVLSAH